MNRLILLIVLTCIIWGCTPKPKPVKQQTVRVNKLVTKTQKVIPPHAIDRPTDSVITLFGDSSYKFRLHISDGENHNVIATLTHFQNGKGRILLSDSLFCSFLSIELKDLNGDQVKDLQIFNTTGGRGGNGYYYLYLVNKKRHALKRIHEFEDLVSPEIDSTLNIITSIGLAGPDMYFSFYRITKSDNLIHLGHDYTQDHDENEADKQYNLAIRKILKENKQ